MEDLLRELAPQILATMVRRYGDFADAEDAVQEALLAAVQQWPKQGVPAQPRGWLLTVASRRLADVWRAEAARHRRERLATQQEPAAPAQPSDVDDSLLLLFLCCYPSLAASSAIPLTLRAVGGLTTAEIARAFLIPEPAMGKRISRAKQRIKDSAIPLRMPAPDEWPQRLRSVLHVLYLMFNEGYAVSAGPYVARADLTGEAIRLGRMLHAALPDEPEVAGLLALMLLTEARRPARTGPHGELVPLAEQNRATWDQDLIAEGVTLISATLRKQRAAYYQLQAAIAGLHARAASPGQTDWAGIDALYATLERMQPSPVITLNRAVAFSKVKGPEAALAMIEPLAGQLSGYFYYFGVRGALLMQLDRGKEARVAFDRAIALANTAAEAAHIRMQLDRLMAGSSKIAPTPR